MGTEPGCRSLDSAACRPPVRMLIADDHALLSGGMRAMLVGEPDLVLMNVGMPGMDGTEATRRIKAERPAVSVLVVTAHPSPDYILDAVRAGAAGYILKTASRDEVFAAIRRVFRNEFPLDQDLTVHLVRRLAREAAPRRRPGPARSGP